MANAKDIIETAFENRLMFFLGGQGDLVRPCGGVPTAHGGFRGFAEAAVGSPVRVRERCRWHFYAIGLPYRCAGDDNSYPGKGERQDTLSATASHPLNGSGPAEGQGNRGGGPLEL